MRKLHQYTLRDLFWSVLVVALGIGWWAHDQKRQVEFEAASAKTEVWRLRAGGLEDMLISEGWKMSWNYATGVMFEKSSEPRVRYNPGCVVIGQAGTEPKARERLFPGMKLPLHE